MNGLAEFLIMLVPPTGRSVGGWPDCYPATFIDRDTYRLFGCDANVLTFLYDYPQVVKEHFLVDYSKPVQSRIKFWQMIGRDTRNQQSCKSYGAIRVFAVWLAVHRAIRPKNICQTQGVNTERKSRSWGLPAIRLRFYTSSIARRATCLATVLAAVMKRSWLHSQSDGPRRSSDGCLLIAAVDLRSPSQYSGDCGLVIGRRRRAHIKVPQTDRYGATTLIFRANGSSGVNIWRPALSEDAVLRPH
jgi:hypothetical protein